MTETLQFLPMRARHLPAVVDLETAVQPHPWTRGMFESDLANVGVDRRWTIAAAGTRLVGFCGLWHGLDEVTVTNIAVAPDRQRRRIGQRLMIDAVRWCRSQGAVALTLEVRAGNTAAQALYRKFAMAPVGLRRNYYVESGEDALIMTADDLTGPVWTERLARLAAEVGMDPEAAAVTVNDPGGVG